MPAKKRLGKLPPKYLFALNPYLDARFTKCPQCDRTTNLRKFPLLIHIDDFGLLTLNLTCRYCPKCEFIITHQDILEQQITIAFMEKEPEVIGNNYLVLGTVAIPMWRKGTREAIAMDELLTATADFKRYMEVKYEPGGWFPAEPGKD